MKKHYTDVALVTERLQIPCRSSPATVIPLEQTPDYLNA
jgi:hypothetical protein